MAQRKKPTKPKRTTKKSQSKLGKLKSLLLTKRIAMPIFVFLFATIGIYLLKSSSAVTVPITCPFTSRPAVSSPYGWRSSTNSFHAGINMSQPLGTPIYASADGNLSGRYTNSGGVNSGYGYYVEIVGGGYLYRYAHIRDVARGAGPVKAGELIAYVGTTGGSRNPTMHFEMRTPATRTFGQTNTIDPAPSYNSCTMRGGAPSQTPTSSGTGRIQGIKRGGDNVLSLEREGTGQRTFINANADGTFYFNNLTVPAVYIVRVNGQGGYNVSWTACAGAVGECHKNPNARGSGTEAKVYLGGGYIDLWWTYTDASSGGTNPLPKGYVDGAGCEIYGWAYDESSSSSSLQIHFYINGGWGGNTLANTSRPDVNQAFGISGNHGFNWRIPSQYRTGSTYSYQAYAIDYPDPNKNTLLKSGTLSCR